MDALHSFLRMELRLQSMDMPDKKRQKQIIPWCHIKVCQRLLWTYSYCWEVAAPRYFKLTTPLNFNSETNPTLQSKLLLENLSNKDKQRQSIELKSVLPRTKPYSWREHKISSFSRLVLKQNSSTHQLYSKQSILRNGTRKFGKNPQPLTGT